MSNGLDPDQDRSYVGPDLGPYCLQRLSAEAKVTTSMLTVRVHTHIFKDHVTCNVD